MTTKSAILKAVRAKCLDCSGGSAQEVALCGSGNCALYGLRFGRDPSPARTAGALLATKNARPDDGLAAVDVRVPPPASGAVADGGLA